MQGARGSTLRALQHGHGSSTSFGARRGRRVEALPEMPSAGRADIRMLSYNMSLQSRVLLPVHRDVEDVSVRPMDEGRLMTAAVHQVDNRIADIPRQFPARVDLLIFQAAQGLRANHECNHPRRRFRRGRNARVVTIICFDISWCVMLALEYGWCSIIRDLQCCNVCQMRACVRCQQHRL